MASLKPFVINQTDIQFILDQLKFLPLFDEFGNAIINWDGAGTVYNSKHVAYADLGSVQANTAAYGTSYQSVTDLAGLRDVSGLNNNLSLVNAEWGAVDQIFTRSAAADYANYSPIMQALADYAYAAAKQYYGKYSDGSVSDGTPTGTFNAGNVVNTNYAISVGGTQTATDGTHITIPNVVDYTPRMISLTTTTAGVTYDTWANHQLMPDGTTPNPDAASHTSNEIYYDANGVATVLDWGQLATVADGGLGQVDPQARLAASAGQNDHFIGGLNPGVSPSNGFFVLFGQFFDHGLDFIDKSSGATIKITLATDDPLYGMKGPDGQPVHEITINRATVQTVDANGPEYVNHTSPFIDQSQTYGSHEQLTNLLREWVPDPTTASPTDFHAGMKLLDGATLATAWTKADGTSTNDTLPTLDELRTHVEATGRDALTWEDVSNLRNRDASGHVITSGDGAGLSGSALLLDMNPRFDIAHLHGYYDANNNGVKDGAEASYGTVEQAGRVDDAIATLNADVKAAYNSGVDLHINANGILELTGLPGAGTLTGASALYPWVDLSNFGIMQTHPNLINSTISAAAHAAAGEILLASVGDHYIAGDGRVNENFGLTSIHHIFHEEHNYQIQNLIDAMHRQDIVSGDPTHASLHGFQIDTGVMNAAGDFVYSDHSIAWDQDKMFNAAKLVVEMEYQHAAVDQYARNVTPNIQEFVGYSSSVNSDVTLEYAQAAFRFGHSTLRETIDTIDPSGGLTGKIMGYALKEAFLGPEKYADVGPAAVLLGMSHQQQNEIDEFVTPALNQGLLGQPLDLAAINIARGRDLGIPTLNDFREAIGLARYTSWNDFGQNMQHPTSLENFIAAYSFDGNMAMAHAIIGLVDGSIAEGDSDAHGFTVSQAYAFIDGGDDGFNHIDTWIGGLAEIHQPGGLLGETFDKVFVNQIESLMDGDRFYYLFRLAGQQFAEEVGNGQLKDIVERNTGLTHLNGNIFGYADEYIDLAAKKEVVAPGAESQTTGNEHKYGDIAAVADGTIGIYSNGGRGNLNDGHAVTIGGVQYIQDTRLEHGFDVNVNVANANFGADSLLAGAPAVVPDIKGNYTIGSPTGWTIAGGVGGLFAPDSAISDPVGHGGGGVVWLQGGATLSQNTGKVLAAGDTYSLSLNVGDRTDEAWPGGEVRLVATNGFVSYALKTASLPEPADGHWLHVTLDSGPIAAAYAGFELRIEVQQNSAGGTNQILVDDIEVTGVARLNDGANLDGTPNSGAESSEVIVGSAGNDLIYAQGGDDTVYGEGGNDTIYGGYGIDRLYGGDGSDHMYGGDNPDLMDGGAGDDFLYGESSGSDINGNDQVIGGSGNDFISGGIGIDKLSGGTGDDRIFGDQDTDPFTHGSDGNDYVDGGSGGDILYGDNGDDVLVGGADQDQMFGGNGDDIIRPGDTTGALTIGTDEVLGGDGVTDEGNKPGTLGFDLIDFSDNAVRPGGVTFNLADQQNPAVNVNGIPKQIAAFQTEGLIGSAGNDRLTGDSAGDAGLADATLDKGENWLIGGSGNDILMGAGGDDVIIGGSIRLDALIGKYNSGYTHNNGNTGLTAADQLQDAQYQGASHRVLYTEDLTDNVGSHQGLLDGAATQGFDKHFTELLRTEMFKDTVLGNSSVAGVADADTGSDTAVYTGNLNKYTIVAVDALGAVVADPHASGFFAVKITDNRTAADLLDANGDPIVDADGNPITLDGTDLVVGVENLKFADQTISPAAYFDKAPVVDLKYQATTQSTQVASDSFTGNGGNAYARGTGWGNNNSWTETGDNNGSGSGQILVDTAGSGQNNNPGLHITGGTTPATFDGASLSRAVNLSAYQSAEVSFSVRQAGISGTETVKVYFSASPPTATDTPIYTISSAADSAATVHTLAITGPFLAGARLYFVASAMNATTDDVYIDNISINRLVTVDQFQGNNNTAAYTELGTAAAITTLPHITDPDVIDTTIASAKIVVSDAVAGDVLNVGALPSGIAATGNGTGVNGMTGATQVSLAGTATHAAYQTALAAITFANTTQDPTSHGNNLTRHVNVTVNDGLKDSAIATTTVTVTGIDNAATALAPDSVITNYGTGTTNPFTVTVADWALVANDTDVDGAVISSATNAVGLTNLAHSTSNGGSISFRDGTPAGGTFQYASGALTATVTVTQDTVGALGGTINAEIIIGNGADTTINALGGNDIVLAGAGNDTVNGGDGNDVIYGNTGDDIVNAGNGDDRIVWSVGDGTDVIDGGASTAGIGDRFVLNGSSQAETFRILAITDPNNATEIETLLAGLNGGNGYALNPLSDILIVRIQGNNTSIVAELRNTEEITINNQAVSSGGGNTAGQGTDIVQIVGDFSGTSLALSTITINGSDDDDTVDISGLKSDHRIVFHGSGGNDQVIGDLRPQDVVDTQSALPPGDQGGSTGNGDGHDQTGGGNQGDSDDQNQGGTSGGDDEHCSSGDHDQHDGQDGGGTPIQPADIPGMPAPHIGTPGNDVMIGGAGENVLSGAEGDDLILGNDGADTLKAGSGDDLVKAGAGDDVVFGNDGNDDLFGGSGRDLLTGDTGDDRLFGDAGDDALEGGIGNDTVYGGTGNDRVIATVGDGDDTYFGDAEEDTLDYSAIAANITADLGNGIGQHGSVTSAQSGTDKVFGFEDFIGGSGNDTIVASSAANVMDGGGGNDTFVFGSAGDADGDTIKGFQPGDKIDLSAIDANTGASGTQSFVLFAGNVFTSAGQVIVTHEVRDGAEHTIVSGNTNGDTAADFKIDVAGNHALTSADFNGVH